MVDFLEGKPRGFCPWCDKPVVQDFDADEGWLLVHPFVKRPECQWEEDVHEDQNRIRYAAQRLEESKLWNKIEKEGGER